ncbi:hypothetical protein EUGRSUZ_I02129 [Eucalyptus grandis]|uniref:Uncharacterized protein n=2 Tax=Eucalyptus grandis TaxID=71139 RepID=A0ACC3JIR1_EUCGR|nr:hypothetical protein EUGRSUZ_I02129 [Eucalyptus grandis]
MKKNLSKHEEGFVFPCGVRSLHLRRSFLPTFHTGSGTASSRCSRMLWEESNNRTVPQSTVADLHPQWLLYTLARVSSSKAMRLRRPST